MSNRKLAIFGIFVWLLSFITSIEDSSRNFISPPWLILLSGILFIIFFILALKRLWEFKLESRLFLISTVALFIFQAIQEITSPQYGSFIIVLTNIAKVVNFLIYFWIIFFLWKLDTIKMQKIYEKNFPKLLLKLDKLEERIYEQIAWKYIEKYEKLIDLDNNIINEIIPLEEYESGKNIFEPLRYELTEQEAEALYKKIDNSEILSQQEKAEALLGLTTIILVGLSPRPSILSLLEKALGINLLETSGKKEELAVINNEKNEVKKGTNQNLEKIE
jgi:hypothetical protein